MLNFIVWFICACAVFVIASLGFLISDGTCLQYIGACITFLFELTKQRLHCNS